MRFISLFGQKVFQSGHLIITGDCGQTRWRCVKWWQSPPLLLLWGGTSSLACLLQACLGQPAEEPASHQRWPGTEEPLLEPGQAVHGHPQEAQPSSRDSDAAQPWPDWNPAWEVGLPCVGWFFRLLPCNPHHLTFLMSRYHSSHPTSPHCQHWRRGGRITVLPFPRWNHSNKRTCWLHQGPRGDALAVEKECKTIQMHFWWEHDFVLSPFHVLCLWCLIYLPFVSFDEWVALVSEFKNPMQIIWNCRLFYWGRQATTQPSCDLIKQTNSIRLLIWTSFQSERFCKYALINVSECQSHTLQCDIIYNNSLHERRKVSIMLSLCVNKYYSIIDMFHYYLQFIPI